MAVILFVGYLGVILWNMQHQKKEQKIPLGWILAIGILVQFGWECALLLGGIRSATILSWGDKILTMVINSLLETNLGMPYVFALYLWYCSHFTEQGKKREKKISWIEALEENNKRKYN